MGRKTWDGIPAKFRPLKERYNHVVSAAGVNVDGNQDTTAHVSLEHVLASLHPETHRAFLIGGAQLYNQALPVHVDRILLTRVLKQIDCDTFLADFTSDSAWRQASHDELCEWVGWDVPEGEVEEKGIKYRYEMWVRE